MRKEVIVKLIVEDDEKELTSKKLKQDLEDAIYTSCLHTFEVKKISINDSVR